MILKITRYKENQHHKNNRKRRTSLTRNEVRHTWKKNVPKFQVRKEPSKIDTLHEFDIELQQSIVVRSLVCYQIPCQNHCHSFSGGSRGEGHGAMAPLHDFFKKCISLSFLFSVYCYYVLNMLFFLYYNLPRQF